jgi:hypothetical protein
VKSEEYIEDCLGGDLVLIKNHPGYLCMAGGLRANRFIVRIPGVPSGITNLYVLDTSKLHKA